MKLEDMHSLTLAHPFSKGIERVSYCVSNDEVRAVAQGEHWQSISERKKDDIGGTGGASTVHSTTFYIGLAQKNCASIALIISCAPLIP